MNENEIIKKMRSDKFIKNNGIVLRTINIGRTSYNRLSQLRKALEPDISRNEFCDCINYLSGAKMIDLRRCDNKEPADIADVSIDDIEAKVSVQGIRLLAGKITDPCIEG